MMNSRLPFVFLSGLLLQAPVAGQAEEKEKQEEDVKGPETTVTVEGRVGQVPRESTTAAKLAVPLLNTPISVSVVDETVIEAQNALVLGDALRNVAGVYVASGFGIFDFFTIRGFDSLATGLVMVDGAAEPEATFYQLYNVERVEVLRGPSAFLWGANSLSGTVNLVRKRPLFNRNFGEVEVTGGSFQTYRGSLDVNWVDPEGEFAFRFNGLHEDAENYREVKDNRLSAANPAMTWRISDRSELSLNFEYIQNDFSPDSGIPLLGDRIPDIDRQSDFQAPFDLSKQDIHRFRADWSYRLSDRVIFRNKFYLSDLEWDSDGTLFGGVFPNQRGSFEVIRIFSSLRDDQRFTGNQSELLFTARTGTVRHEMVAGFEFSRLDDDFTLDNFFLPTIDLFNPVEFARPEFLVPIQGQGERGEARSLVYAPYVLDRIVFSDYVELFAGGRLDHIDFEDPVNGLDRSDTQFSPLAGVVLKPASDTSFYASFGRAFATPSTLTTEPGREPEESQQVEGGFKQEFLDGRALASVSVYHLERENIAIFDENGVTTQSGDQRSRGVEFEVSAELLPNWFAYASYAFNDAELTEFNEFVQVSPTDFALVDRSGNDPSFAPEHLFHFWTHAEFASGWGLGFGARYVSEQFIAEDNAFAIDEYLLLDAMASYTLRNWRFSINLENLGDADYETRGFSRFSVIPGDPFAAYGSVRYAFDF